MPATLTRLHGSRLLGWNRADGPMLEGLLVVVFALQAVFGVVYPLLAVLGLRAPGTSRLVAVGRPDEVALVGFGHEEVTLTITDPDIGQRLLFELPGMFVAALALLGVWLMFQLARTFRAGDPFAPANPRRIYKIALLVFPGYAIGEMIESITNRVLFGGAPLQDGVRPAPDLSYEPIAIFFLVVALAEMFRLGTRLRDDTEGLV